MKILRPRHFVVFALAALSGTILMHTSQSVQQAEERLNILQTSVTREEEKIRLLKAEWESLNNPERLERLAKEFLDLVPPQPDRFVEGLSALPDPAPEDQEVLLRDEGAEALQPVSVQPAAGESAQKNAKEIITREPGKDLGDVMKELGARQ